MRTFCDQPRVSTSVRGAAMTLLAGAVLSLTPAAQGQSPGPIAGWGRNNEGQVSGIPAGEDFIAVAAGAYHSVAIRSDGTLASWGFDFLGSVSGTPSGTFVAVDAGLSRSVAIRDDGTLVAWGHWDSGGQPYPTPAGVYTAVRAGTYHNVAIRPDGTLLSWGSNSFNMVSNTPAGSFLAADAGGQHSVAIRDNGTLITWGDNGFGQVSGTPTGTFTAIAAGGLHTVAMRTDGTLVSWGFNGYGEVSGTPSGSFIAISAGYFHSVALRADGTLISWGLNSRGQVSGTPPGAFIAIAAGGEHTMAIAYPDSDGDGLTHTDEVNLYGTDPFNPDTDGDGLLDGTEIDMAMGSGCPDPLSHDSDGDSLADGAEVGAGTMACSADSDADGINDADDPTPTDPGVPDSYVEAALRTHAEVVVQLDLLLIDAPNNNAAVGRRNAMSNKLVSAANKVATGDVEGAIGDLLDLLEKVDGQRSPPDWMTDGPEKDALRAEIEGMILLLRM